MGVASLILGIISLIFAFFVPGLQWVGAIPGLIGIILGASARKDPAQAGIGTGGMVCSIIGFIFSVILYLACAACVAGIASSM